MSLHNFLTALRRRVRLVVAILVLSVVGAGVLSWLSTARYEAEATLYFSVRSAQGVDDLSNGASFTREQMSSFASLAVTPTVLEYVAARLDHPGGAAALRDAVSATAANDTVLLTVSATDTDARRAAAVANAVAERTITVVANVSPTDPLGGEGALKVSIVTPASVPSSPSSPNTVLNLAAGVVLGLTLGVLAALGREALDTRVRTPEQATEVTGLPVIGSIPTGSSRGVTLEIRPHDPQAEAYRQLRTNLQFLHVAGGARPGRTAQVLTVTSSVAGEGKSTTAVNLALVLAEISPRVLLVDTDLRRPSVASVLGIEGAAGLTTVLLGEADVDDVVQPWGRTGLHVLASGALPPNPSELLASSAMRGLLDRLRADYDYVILDSAPLLPVADGASLSGLVDGTVVLANATRVRRHQLAESRRSLARVEATVLGIVLNQVRRDERTYGYYRSDRDPSERSVTPAPAAPGVPVLAGP